MTNCDKVIIKFIILGSGRLYTFGSNDWGQLGHGNTKPYTKPGVVKSK
jgi:alpha-tubulin suppressor-like RCC1 family protein